jgi:hypothetical protein
MFSNRLEHALWNFIQPATSLLLADALAAGAIVVARTMSDLNRSKFSALVWNENYAADVV